MSKKGRQSMLLTDAQREWDKRAEQFKDSDPVIVRGNSASWYAKEVEDNIKLFKVILNLQPNDTLLEIGCGNALYLNGLADSVKRSEEHTSELQSRVDI